MPWVGTTMALTAFAPGSIHQRMLPSIHRVMAGSRHGQHRKQPILPECLDDGLASCAVPFSCHVGPVGLWALLPPG